jgi:hypothetical protein
MESGPSWVNAPHEGPVIPRSRRSLSRTKASVEVSMHTSDRQVARGWGAACKGKGGEGRWSAPGMVQCRGTEEMGNGCGCLPGAWGRYKDEGGRGIEYKQPSSFGSRRGDQDRTSETVFIKLQRCKHTGRGGRASQEAEKL